MDRKIGWQSGVLDEINLVYEKANENEQIGKQLEDLEALALSEAKYNCGLKTDSGEYITPEQFDGLSSFIKEKVITTLATVGLGSLSADIPSATLILRFTPMIPKVLGCTMFDVLNRLEKLDGAISILAPKWTLEVQVPLGGKKGLFQWEMLIMQLYPWISIRETSTNEMAKEVNIQAIEQEQTDTVKEVAEKAEEKPVSKNILLLRRIFGEKNPENKPRLEKSAVQHRQVGRDTPTVKDILAKFEGKERLLYSDPSNPYESIYIKAGIKNGLLTVTDSECEHGPDGGWSYERLVFDKINTEKALFMLLEKNSDPFDALKSMLTYKNRTQIFQNMCKSRGIRYENLFSL